MIIEKIHVVYSVELTLLGALRVAQTKGNYFRYSLSNTIGETKPSTQENMLVVVLLQARENYPVHDMLVHKLSRDSKLTWKLSIGKFYSSTLSDAHFSSHEDTKN